MLDHLRYQAALVDSTVESCLRAQCLDEQSPYYGAMVDVAQGITGPSSGAGFACRMVEGYCVPGGKYQGDEELLKRALLGMEFTLRLVHEDGTIDLLTTNFHDASETAFSIQGMGQAYLMLEKYGRGAPAEEALRKAMYTYIDRSADGMVNGGFHTPNHRWVHSSALALCWKVTGRQDCLDKLRLYLNEGIDCDEEGEFTERSAGVYNIICDRSLILLSEVLGEKEYLSHVERNLNMVEKYFEPDHTVNTVNSSRQDVGTSPDWRIYYGNYLYMALRTGRADFVWIADEMLRQSLSAPMFHEQNSIPRCDVLYFLLTDPSVPEKMQTLSGTAPVPSFRKHFIKSGIVRAREGDLTLTLVRSRPQFARLQYGVHTMFLRLAGSFYAKGQFEAQSIEDTADGWRMRYFMRWGYKGPLVPPPETSDWHEMDHSRRPDVFMQDYQLDVDVRFGDKEAVFTVESKGIERVPVKLELMLDPGGLFANEGVELRARPGDYVYPKVPSLTYQYTDRHMVRVEGAFHSHDFGENMRGTLGGDPQKFTVAFTGQTPVKQTVRFTFR